MFSRHESILSLRLAVIPALLMFAIGCGGYSAPAPAPSPAPTPAPSPVGASSSVTIPARAEFLGDRAYTPDNLDVTVGTSVTWTNTDSTSHTSTSDGTGWNSGTLAPGGRFSFVFQTTGTFKYHCSIHPGMVGTVVVR
jgi:plastocyanin